MKDKAYIVRDGLTQRQGLSRTRMDGRRWGDAAARLRPRRRSL